MAAACRLGLIPLLSHAVNEMKGPFDDIGENDFTDVELSLSVLCTSDDTIEVTSNDFVLDARRNDVMPVGEASASQKNSTVTLCSACWETATANTGMLGYSGGRIGRCPANSKRWKEQTRAPFPAEYLALCTHEPSKRAGKVTHPHGE